MATKLTRIEFRARGQVLRRARIMPGEAMQDAARRVGITLGDDNGNGDGTVRLAEYDGRNGECRAR